MLFSVFVLLHRGRDLQQLTSTRLLCVDSPTAKQLGTAFKSELPVDLVWFLVSEERLKPAHRRSSFAGDCSLRNMKSICVLSRNTTLSWRRALLLQRGFVDRPCLSPFCPASSVRGLTIDSTDFLLTAHYIRKTVLWRLHATMRQADGKFELDDQRLG